MRIYEFVYSYKFVIRRRMKNAKSLLVAIIGPTASGKSALAVKLARKFNGEVISADSRQVYKGLDIGSGKATKKEMMGIPHYLLDVASPKRRFTVAQYQMLALQAIARIQKKGKLPLLAGGSPFYVYAVIDGLVIPEVKPSLKLRKELAKLSVQELIKKLKTLDPKRAQTLQQNSGAKNARRVIRALEIVLKTGKPVPESQKKPLPYPVLMIGIKRSQEELKRRIRKRLFSRIKHGLIDEVKRLRKSGLPWKRLEEFGLEYRNVAQYLQGKITRQEMIERIQKESEHFARRQMQWFKKDSRIHWTKDQKEAKRFVATFLK